MLSLCHAFPLSLTWNVSPLQPDNYYGNGLQLHDGTLLMCGSQMLFDNATWDPPHKVAATDGGFRVRSTDHGALSLSSPRPCGLL